MNLTPFFEIIFFSMRYNYTGVYFYHNITSEFSREWHREEDGKCRSGERDI